MTDKRRKIIEKINNLKIFSTKKPNIMLEYRQFIILGSAIRKFYQCPRIILTIVEENF